MKGHQCLQRLQQINSVLFKVYLKETVEKCPIQETVDFLHALLGFCTDPTLILQQTQGQGTVLGNVYQSINSTAHILKNVVFTWCHS